MKTQNSAKVSATLVLLMPVVIMIGCADQAPSFTENISESSKDFLTYDAKADLPNMPAQVLREGADDLSDDLLDPSTASETIKASFSTSRKETI